MTATLPPEELEKVLALPTEEASELFISGTIDKLAGTVTLTRGDKSELVVPFSIFKISGDNIMPDFDNFSITDYGNTIKFGEYEAASDEIIAECEDCQSNEPPIVLNKEQSRLMRDLLK